MLLFRVIFIYILTVFSFTRTTHCLTILVIMELFSWILSILLKAPLKYLVIQRIFLPIGVIGLIYNYFVWSMSLLYKIGLPPFHLWLVKIIQEVSISLFLFIRTLHKLVPIFVMLIFLRNELVILIISVFSAIFLLIISSFLLILIYSSFLHSGWILLAGYSKIIFSLVYWSVYSLVLILLVRVITTRFRSLLFFYLRLAVIIFLLILSGIPPFTMFWIKVIVLINLGWNKFIRLIMLYLAFMAIWAYMRLAFVCKNLRKRMRILPILVVYWIFYCFIY